MLFIRNTRKPDFFPYAKKKDADQLRSIRQDDHAFGQDDHAFVFATWIVQSLYYVNQKYQASS